MVEAVDIVTQIVEVALKIKEAVDTVRENKEACLQIKRRVERVRLTLSLCEDNAELMKNSAVRAALEALGEILGEALELVSDCQERSFVCLYCTARKLSKQLSKVDQDISNLYSEATFAIVCQLWEQKQDGAHRPPARPSLPVPESPHEVPFCPFPFPFPFIQSVYAYSDVRPQKPARIPSDAHGGEMADQQQQRSLLQEIGQVALEIREAVQTVRQNKQECTEIDKRANRVSDLLSRFENTETMKDPAMIAQLEKLLETLRHARTLVTACQRRNTTIIWPAGKPSKQLREVLDQMVLALHDMIAISAGRASTV